MVLAYRSINNGISSFYLHIQLYKHKQVHVLQWEFTKGPVKYLISFLMFVIAPPHKSFLIFSPSYESVLVNKPYEIISTLIVH